MIIGKIGSKKIDTTGLGIQGVPENSLNVFVKTALLTTLAGYLEKDSITIEGDKYFPKAKLESFLSYILNDLRAAPRTFALDISFSKHDSEAVTTEKNDYDCILSFSGGVDSTAGALYAMERGKKILPVWISFGQKNEGDELATVQKLCKKLKLSLLIVKIDLKSYVDEGWERWKLGIIPARNLMFAAIASQIASQSIKKKVQIYICAHKEEINYVNTDKSKRFFSTCNKIFSRLYGEKVELTTPFFTYTKPEIISYWKRHWSNQFGVYPHQTVSCYLGNNCGVCKACFNRAVAFACAGEKLDKYILNPFADEKEIIYKGYVERFPSLQMERKLDILYSLSLHKTIIPERLKTFLSARYPRYQKRIIQRITSLEKVKIK